MFEGGVRSASFVYGLPGATPGTVHAGLFHSVDWLPTLAKLGGADTSRNLALDGMDIAPAIVAGGVESPHSELPVQITGCGKLCDQQHCYATKSTKFLAFAHDGLKQSWH